MRRLLATLALGLVLAGCSDRSIGPIANPNTGATPASRPSAIADPIARGCNDYATALQLATPVRAAIPAKAVAIIDKANAVTALACVFGSAGGHYSTAVAGWAAAKGAS